MQRVKGCRGSTGAEGQGVQNRVTGCIQSSLSMQMSIKGAEDQGVQWVNRCRGSRGAEGQQVHRVNRSRGCMG